MFKVGDQVKINTVVPQGEITKMRMEDNGTIWYLMSWTNGEVTQERWFLAEELVAAG